MDRSSLYIFRGVLILLLAIQLTSGNPSHVLNKRSSQFISSGAQKIKDLKKKITQMNDTINELKRNYSDSRKEIAVWQSRVESLQRQLDNIIESHTQEINDLENQIDRLKSIVEAKNRESINSGPIAPMRWKMNPYPIYRR